MTDRPILFSGEMVRAILDGRKTQTRRVVQARRFDAADVDEAMGRDGWGMVSPGDNWTPGEIAREFPNRYGKPGDRLWVRETWTWAETYQIEDASAVAVCYAADDAVSRPIVVDDDMVLDRAQRAIERYEATETKWHPSIHMPRWASRLTLEITNVRIERLQDISEADCDAEGFGGAYPHRPTCDHPLTTGFADDRCGCGDYTLPQIYGQLWDRLNAKRGYGWDVNPWVWVIEFRSTPHEGAPS